MVTEQLHALRAKNALYHHQAEQVEMVAAGNVSEVMEQTSVHRQDHLKAALKLW